MSEKKVKVEGQGEETVTSGCPSLGLPRLPGGFDGAEPVAKMNAEAVFEDLVDVVLKAAREAPVDRTARDAFYRTVLGDVAHAVASVVPAEKLSEPVFFTPPLAAQFAKGERRGKGKFNASEMRVAKTPETVVFQATMTTGRTLSAELTSCGEAFLYDGSEAVCHVTFDGQYTKFKWSYPIIRRMLNGLMSVCGHRHRNNVNRAERKGGE